MGGRRRTQEPILQGLRLFFFFLSSIEISPPREREREESRVSVYSWTLPAAGE
jgi:hypothetical protein